MRQHLAWVALAAAWALAAGCEMERRVIQDNSPNAKFAALFGGSTDTSDGSTSGGMWQVSRGDAPKDQKPVSEQAKRIAELLRQQSSDPRRPRPSLSDPSYNTGGWNITTNFQTSEEPAPGNTPPPPLNPPGTGAPIAPVLPGGPALPAVPAAPNR